MSVAPEHGGEEWDVGGDPVAVDGDGDGALFAEDGGDVGIEDFVVDCVCASEDDDGGDMVFFAVCEGLVAVFEELFVVFLLSFDGFFEGVFEAFGDVFFGFTEEFGGHFMACFFELSGFESSWLEIDDW